MSRINILQSKKYRNNKTALDFLYERLWAPPIYRIIPKYEVDEIYKIATDLKLSAKVKTKYKLIDEIMGRYGFVRAHRGTNRIVYNYVEDPRFVAKVAYDIVGCGDNPAEFKNQRLIAPFCCKIFEVDQTGVLAFVERVNPVSSLEEFESIKDDIFNMMVTKIIGKYVVADLGIKKYLNYGIRVDSNGHSFGPVVLDFPYVYELDGRKLYCSKCGGEIDYDDYLTNLRCEKCGKSYTALDLKKSEQDGGDGDLLIYYKDENPYAVRVVDGDGNTILESTPKARYRNQYKGGKFMWSDLNRTQSKVKRKTFTPRKEAVERQKQTFILEQYKQNQKLKKEEEDMMNNKNIIKQANFMTTEVDLEYERWMSGYDDEDMEEIDESEISFSKPISLSPVSSFEEDNTFNNVNIIDDDVEFNDDDFGEDDIEIAEPYYADDDDDEDEDPLTYEESFELLSSEMEDIFNTFPDQRERFFNDVLQYIEELKETANEEVVLNTEPVSPKDISKAIDTISNAVGDSFTTEEDNDEDVEEVDEESQIAPELNSVYTLGDPMVDKEQEIETEMARKIKEAMAETEEEEVEEQEVKNTSSQKTSAEIAAERTKSYQEQQKKRYDDSKKKNRGKRKG